jgi:hypothetical protein
VADVRATLERRQVPERECGELLALMGTLKAEIVECPAA